MSAECECGCECCTGSDEVTIREEPWTWTPVDIPVVEGIATLPDGRQVECAPGVQSVRWYEVTA